ncbi:FKBP-type peptidyl-prolyl cis-trans isomerase [Formicincola oecophyllae]|uniref:Peptidyl-prolyl cis-trans isomerase n=1 Tax=Formicincola oecophyllae TaxID=2558361 RepID=A0A4Y6UAA2_9PROT|nr:FKBP-type peptidyl-prolyl cis-trans isomerase [Formicincola oecophyllae]QDH13075.1 FKBP-type peptidyl-prolyl cis-trans isomerase [Formicincola oecophyllae]
MNRFARMGRLLAPVALCASMGLGLVACGGGDDQPEQTPAQFMASVAKQPGVHVLKDGLAYKVIKSGPKDAPSPRKGSMMMIIYEGRLPDGAIFDSSEMHTGAAYMEMPLDGVIEGWMQALPMMHVGDIWELYVPPKLGYGDRALGVIPPNSPLIFKIQLLGVDDGNNQQQ